MIFVDANVFMYAVGRPHSHRAPARRFFREAVSTRTPLCTSAEVMQELLHAYLPVGRLHVFDAVQKIISGAHIEVWPLEKDDVLLARTLRDRHPSLQSRDLCHLASCRRRNVKEFKTFDQDLSSAVGNP